MQLYSRSAVVIFRIAALWVSFTVWWADAAPLLQWLTRAAGMPMSCCRSKKSCCCKRDRQSANQRHPLSWEAQSECAPQCGARRVSPHSAGVLPEETAAFLAPLTVVRLAPSWPLLGWSGDHSLRQRPPPAR